MSTRSRYAPRINVNERVAKALRLREAEGLSWVAVRERLGPGVVSAALKIQAARRAI